MASHDCFYHSLTTCLGELDNEDIQVTITDDAIGLIEVSYQGAYRHHGVFHHRRRCHLCHRPAPDVMAQQSPHLRLSPISLKSCTKKG